MKPIFQDRKGVAILTVVLFFLVMVTLLGGLLFATVNNLKNTQTAQKHTAVYYAAESGINLTVSRFLDLFKKAEDLTWLSSELDTSFENLKNQINVSDYSITLKDNLGNPVSAIVSVSESFPLTGYPNHKFYTIRSIGTIDGVQRTLTTNFGYQYIVGEGIEADIAGAIIVNGTINITKGTVTGAIASNMKPEGTAFMNVPGDFSCDKVGDEYGDISLPQEYLDNVSTILKAENPCPSITKPLDKPIIFGAIGLPPYPLFSDLVKVTASKTSLTLPSLPTGKKGFYIDNLEVNINNGSFLIDLGEWATNDDQLIYLRVRNVNGIDFEKGSIVIEGKGRLMLLVDQTSNIDIAANINIDKTNKDPNKFMLVFRTYNKPYTLKINNNTQVVSSILTDSTADINWGNMDYYGFLISNAGFVPGENAVQTYTGEVNFQAGSKSGVEGYPPIWIYAPYANVHLHSSKTEVYGTVMGNSFSMQTQQGGITYAFDDNIKYPFDDWTPLPQYESGDPVNASVKFVIAPIKEN